jgi:hypothetical protein
MLTCAAVVPDYSTRMIDKMSDKPRVQLVVSPWGTQICCTGKDSRGVHRTKMSVVVSQHNKVFEDVAIVDNNTGSRFNAAQSVGVSYYAGVGLHVLKVATFSKNEDGSVKEITWQTSRRFTIIHCHGKDESLMAGGS